MTTEIYDRNVVKLAQNQQYLQTYQILTLVSNTPEYKVWKMASRPGMVGWQSGNEEKKKTVARWSQRIKTSRTAGAEKIKKSSKESRNETEN